MKDLTQYINLLTQYKKENAKHYGILRMGIFGSVARGEQTEDSDVDVYIESDAVSLLDLSGILLDLKELLGTKVDIVRKHKYLKPGFIQRIEKDMIYV